MALHGFSYKLKWSDFKKKSTNPDGGTAAAQTTTDLGVRWSAKVEPDGKWKLARVSVTITLNRAETWVVRGKESDDLLKHEQVHYDIAAIAGRTLESKLLALRGDRSQDPAQAVRALIEELGGRQSPDGTVIDKGVAQEVQDRYDEDATCGSNHGLDKVHQVIWRTRLNDARLDKTTTIYDLDSCPRETAKPAAAGQ